ncbi:MAG TPA: Verru_Chthon cassette protein D [Prosthecobacter sp.]|nr:Verru_Chthon cassette protein D [Prosthecobacter sp.]
MKTLLLSKVRSRQHRGAFTLVEMLTVVGIIAMLVALVTPALVDVIRSTRLNAAGDGLVNRLSLAQQSAVSLGQEVEIRFYQYINDDSDRPGVPLFYAYQVVEMPVVNGVVQPRALSDVYYIESGIVLSGQQGLSPLLQTTVQQQELPNQQFLFRPTAQDVDPRAVQFAALRFYPDGSCKSLSGDDPGTDVEASAKAYTIPALIGSFVTFVESREADSDQPKNFYCIQIDSYTGKTRVYRP